jgi:EAL domain-containing protein (putative c-di-GMP-specific phosphodiesterase class I)
MLNDRAYVQGVIGLAQTFTRSFIAESVESSARCEQLIALGCCLAQGFAIAKPMLRAISLIG